MRGLVSDRVSFYLSVHPGNLLTIELGDSGPGKFTMSNPTSEGRKNSSKMNWY